MITTVKRPAVARGGPALTGWKRPKAPYLLAFIEVVPVAGLEPARLFIVPGF
jgi:hypothetical protein